MALCMDDPNFRVTIAGCARLMIISIDSSSKGLTSPALKWFTSLDMAAIQTWKDLSQEFVKQYSFNLNLIPKREDLVAIW